MQTRLALILICIWPCAAPFLPAASWAVSQDYTGPFPPEQALRTFQLPEGFRIELVAAEPDVLDPVAMSFDEDGRLYVIEMRDYPSGPPAPPGRVRLLEDTNGDGRMDRSQVFADGLPYPTGVLAWKGGMLVTAAPDLLYLEDTDHDGRADVREVVLTGFGEGNPQHRVNGLCYGLDNWIYAANGYGQIRSGRISGAQAVQVSGSDFRFRPETGAFELVSGRSQFALALDDWGNRFINNNANHIRHPVLPRHYLERNPHLAIPTVMDDISDHGSLARVYPLSKIEERFNEFHHAGHTTTACGLAIYRGGAFPGEYRGNSYVCEPLHNLIHRDILAPQGVSFVARRGEEDREFLASTDNWFRPVNLTVGPDGALYIADFYRKVIEHPFGITLEMQLELDFRAGDDKGRIYRVTHSGAPRFPRPKLSRASPAKLVEHLESSNAWWRLTAQRLLVERQEKSAIRGLKRLVRQSKLPLARLHALWTLDGLAALDAESVRLALQDAEPGVREHALRLSETFFSARASALTSQKTQGEHDTEPPPRRISPSQLTQLSDAVLALVKDENPRVRFQLAFTSDELVHGARTREGALHALARLAMRDGSDPWLRSAVLSSVAGAEVELLSRLRTLDRDFLESPRPGAIDLARMLADSVGSRGNEEEVVPLLKVVAAGAGSEPAGWQRAALASLIGRLHQAGVTLAPLTRSAGVTEELARWSAQMVQAAGETNRPATERAEAISLLALAPAPKIAPRLQEWLHPQEPPEVQRAAIRALGAIPNAQVARALLDRWAACTMPIREEILAALLNRAQGIGLLLDAIAKGEIHAMELSPSWRDRLLWFPEEKVRQRAQSLFHPKTPEARQKKIEYLRASLQILRGNAMNGRRIFLANCAHCHNRRTATEGILYKGLGSNTGPDLGGLRGRSKEALVTDIVDPSRAVDPRYLNYLVQSTNGRFLYGIIETEMPGSVTLLDGREAKVVLRSNISTITSTGLSLMPEGFEDFPPQDLADLVEYLKQD
ncbi:MAG: PVC-type heme-binding CxxCH protein [Verrucomicrobiota bacterium]